MYILFYQSIFKELTSIVHNILTLTCLKNRDVEIKQEEFTELLLSIIDSNDNDINNEIIYNNINLSLESIISYFHYCITLNNNSFTILFNYTLNLKKQPTWVTSILSFIPNDYVLQLYNILKKSDYMDTASLLCFHYNTLIKLNVDFNELDELILKIAEKELLIRPKQALYLLLLRAKTLYPEKNVVAAAPIVGNDNDNGKPIKKNKKQYSCANTTDKPDNFALDLNSDIGKRWHVFFGLWDSSDEFSQHLLKDMIPSLPLLYYSTYSFSKWLNILLIRFFKHTNARLRKMIILNFLEFKFVNNENLNVGFDFIFSENFFECLNQGSLIQGDIGKALTSFYVNYYNALDDDRFHSVDFGLNSDKAARKELFINRLINCLPMVVSHNTLSVLLDILMSIDGSTALNDESCLSLFQVNGIIAKGNEYTRNKLYEKIILILLKFKSSNCSFVSMAKVLEVIPVEYYPFFNISIDWPHYIMNDFFDSGNIKDAPRLARMFVICNGNFGELFEEIFSGLYSRPYLIAEKKEKCVSFLHYLLENLISISYKLKKQNSTQVVIISFPDIYNALSGIMSKYSHEIASHLESNLYLHNNLIDQDQIFYSIENINITISLYASLFNLFPVYFQDYISGITIAPLQKCESTLYSTCHFGRLFASIKQNKISINSSDMEYLVNLVPPSRSTTSKFEIELNFRNQLNLQFYSFKWGSIAHLFKTVSFINSSFDHIKELVEKCLDSLSASSSKYAMLILDCLREVMPILARKSIDSELLVKIVSDFVDSCVYAINDIETIGEESSILLCQGFISILIQQDLMLESLHKSDGPIHKAITFLMDIGKVRAIRYAYLIASNLLPALLLSPRIANLYFDIFTDLCLYLTPEAAVTKENFEYSKDDEKVTADVKNVVTLSAETSFNSVEIGDPQVCLVRVVTLHFMGKFMELASLPTSKSIIVQSFINNFVFHLITGVNKELVFSTSLLHAWSRPCMQKYQLWQILCILAPSIKLETPNLENLIELAWNSWDEKNRGDIQQYIELFLVSLFCRLPELIPKLLFPRIHNICTMCHFHVASLLIISYFSLGTTSTDFFMANESLVKSLLDIYVPLLLSNYGQTRTLAQYTWTKLYERALLIPGFQPPLHFKEIEVYLSSNIDAQKIIKKFSSVFDALNVASIYTIEKCISEITLPITSLFTLTISSLIQRATADVLSDIKLTYRPNDEEDDSSRGFNSKNDSLVHDYQKKIIPLQSSFLEMMNEVKSRENTLATFQTRKRFDVIMVASLIDRIPNIAGLARTCEIFNASKLIIHDKKVIDDPNFVSIAVTSHLWMPIEEVRERDVAKYLLDKKKEGYTILALEQTANSISLEHFKFPKKICILLGKEKEGIPIDFIQIVDKCIQIPQFGMIRSLNVHVSGAILLWSYVRDQCLEIEEVQD